MRRGRVLVRDRCILVDEELVMYLFWLGEKGVSCLWVFLDEVEKSVHVRKGY